MKNKIISFSVVAIAVLGVALFLSLKQAPTTPTQREYRSETFGIVFSHPSKYFVVEADGIDVERIQHSIVLIEDTPENRALVSGEISGTETPPVITIGIFQNDLDNYTTESFIRDNAFSNFKLSNGELTETTVGGERAFRYGATGLYENDNVVVARPAFVYMFTGFYNTTIDAIRADFESVLSSVEFF